MTRTQYRFYLYTVFIALLVFAAVAVGQLLNVALEFTPLHSVATALPSSNAVVQAVVFVVISLLVAGPLGGFHYWLIRRDMLHDPDAANSSIRALFLHGAEAIGMVLSVAMIGLLVFCALGLMTKYEVEVSKSVENVGIAIGALAVALPTFGCILLLALELRRAPITHTSGVAIAFQRIHFYGVQLCFLLLLTLDMYLTLPTFVAELFFPGNRDLHVCTTYYCSTSTLIYLLLSILWFVFFWAAYGRLTNADRSVPSRLILHGVSFAYGVVWLLYGVYLLLAYIISPVFNVNISLYSVLTSFEQYDFIGPLVLGVLFVYAYNLLLRNIARQGLIGKRTVQLTEMAIVAGLMAAFFWSGCGTLFYTILQYLMPTSGRPTSDAWMSSLVCVVVGLTYIPLDIYLRRQAATDERAAGPRRGLVLALLGGGIVTAASGGVATLFALITALFGTPLNDWQQITQTELAILLIGIVLIGIYLRDVKREHLISDPAKPTETAFAPANATPGDPDVSTPVDLALATPVDPQKIETILDELAHGNITRDEAIRHIQALNTLP